MEFLIEHWRIVYLIVVFAVVVSFCLYWHFTAKKECTDNGKTSACEALTNELLQNVREWLLYAVSIAEKELGGGTGKLKLRQVYDLFLTRFPTLVRLVPFDLFSQLVDDALIEMREMLESNQAVATLITGATDTAQEVTANG